MRFSKKFNKALDAIKDMESQYAERCKNGSKDQIDYLEMSYFSGLHNGFKLVWYILDNSEKIKEEDFNELLSQVLHLDERAN